MSKADDLKARMGLSGPALERFQSAPPAIPDHELVRRVGQGSYGEVWLACSAVGTWRAVKVVYRDHFKDARPYDREFSGIQKYEPISRTNEGLVDVLQIGRNDAEGYFYYVMELADDAGPPPAEDGRSKMDDGEGGQAGGARGQKSEVRDQKPEVRGQGFDPHDYIPKTLAWAIQARGRLPMEECITLGLTLNLALGHLHRSGLIHRDVKPSNIIFVNGVPKLADIGLVTDLAKAQSFVGTEGFIPPEGPNSPQADIYALGKVLYEASMGKDRQEFPEPFTRLGLDAESQALMELNAVLLKACAPKAKERYQTAEEMNADLALLHSGKSVKDKHALERRLKMMMRAGAVAAVVLALGAVGYVLAVREAGVAKAAAKTEAGLRQEADQATRDAKAARVEERKHRVQAEANEKKAQTEAAKSTQVAQFLKDMLKGVGPSVALGRDTRMLREILDKTAQGVEDLKDQPAVEADLWAALGNVYSDLGEYTKAVAMHSKALEARRKLLGEDHADTAASLNDLGEVLVRQGKNNDAEPLLTEALARRKQLLGNEHPDVAQSLHHLGMLFYAQGKAADAEAMLRQALALQRKVLGNEHRDIAISLNQLGLILGARGKYVEAEAVHREALVLRKKLLGSEHPDVAESMHKVAWTLNLQGRLSEAEDVFREALAMRRKLLGNEHPELAYTLLNFGTTLLSHGKYVEAETLYREALAMLRKLFGDHDPKVVSSLSALVGALEKQAKLAEAETLLREALAISTERYGGWHPSAALLHDRLVRVFQDEGKLDEAESFYREHLANLRARSPADDPAVAAALTALVNFLLAHGKAAEAETLARECLAVREEKHPDNWYTFYTRSILGEALLGQKKYAEAESSLVSAYEGMKQHNEKLPSRRTVLKGTLQRLVQLYESTGRAEQAAAWKGVITSLYCEQAEEYRKSADGGNVLALNNLAWLLATCADSEVRDGRNAVTFAETAVSATNRKDLTILDTLAAAYAETGQFAKAVSVQKEVIGLNQVATLKEGMTKRLKLYESNSPYREP